jgi:phage terminase large subunit-like protein
VQSWDTANKESEPAMHDLGVEGNRMYLLDVFRKRIDFRDLMRAVCTQAECLSANAVLVENEASAELLSFPNCRYDDQVDSTVLCVSATTASPPPITLLRINPSSCPSRARLSA